MNNEIRKDIFGETPKIGDIIVYNPAKYKGLVYGTCVEINKIGLPIVYLDKQFHGQHLGQRSYELDHYVPKTGFVIKKINNNK